MCRIACAEAVIQCMTPLHETHHARVGQSYARLLYNNAFPKSIKARPVSCFRSISFYCSTPTEPLSTSRSSQDKIWSGLTYILFIKLYGRIKGEVVKPKITLFSLSTAEAGAWFRCARGKNIKCTLRGKWMHESCCNNTIFELS